MVAIIMGMCGRSEMGDVSSLSLSQESKARHNIKNRSIGIYLRKYLFTGRWTLELLTPESCGISITEFSQNRNYRILAVHGIKGCSVSRVPRC